MRVCTCTCRESNLLPGPRFLFFENNRSTECTGEAPPKIEGEKKIQKKKDYVKNIFQY